MDVDDVELREDTGVVYVFRLGRFVSLMLWCFESALRRWELRHSVALKAELRRSIEVVLAGNHFVAENINDRSVTSRNQLIYYINCVTTCRLTPVLQQYVVMIIQKIQCTQLQRPFLWPKGDLVLRYP